MKTQLPTFSQKLSMTLSLILFLSLITSCSYFPDYADAPLSILQGGTTETSTILAILEKKNTKHSWKVISKTQKNIPFQKTIHPLNDQWKMVHLTLNNLNKKNTYTLQVFKKKSIVDSRTFQTLDFSFPPSIAILSCTSVLHLKSYRSKMNKSLMRQNPTAIFYIGDTAYADLFLSAKKVLTKVKLLKPDLLTSQHIATRRQLGLFKSKKLTPIFASWDDHDYGQNNGDGSYPHKKMARTLFRKLFPLGESSLGPGNSFAFSGWNTTFIFTDNRTFRNLDKTYGLWGFLQQNWVVSQIKSSKNPVWLIDGGQFFGAYHPFESFEKGFPKNFKSFLDQVKNVSSSKNPVTFFSGDRHVTELMKISSDVLGYSTWEITSSPFYSKLYPRKKPLPNKRRLYHLDNKHNFVLMTQTKQGWQMDVFSSKKDKVWSTSLNR